MRFIGNALGDSLSPFQRARLILSGWYVLLSGGLIVLFTLLVFGARESSFVKVHRVIGENSSDSSQADEFESHFEELDKIFKERLVIFDVILFLMASLASYLLAGKTLKPIQEMMKEQEEFSADVSHELRTPLTTMGVIIEAKIRKMSSKDNGWNVLNSLREEVDHMTHIVEGLLTLMRIKNDRVNVKKEKVKLQELSQEAIDKRSMQLNAKEQELKVTMKSEPIIMNCFRDQIIQVVIILLDNAIKYSPSKSQIKIKVSSDRSYAIFSTENPVRVSFDTNEINKLFTRFYRGKGGNKQVKGSGLGLAIAKKIVDHHDGVIGARKKGGNKVIFFVRLPLANE